ncbi:hypothetical protein Q5H93_12400 [Hymenobacter sp. ASUV-10]|uniref:Uncharacterized protein n=1 Tax=Hymenobacter aranciens TaxID=3063996 RepID=A0ABT9BB85_9BACT|nr:hypothetical protein [Hymenobacter sp. ASUV-10]MDO7875536.1 hypothetical protein [Hymenobacter sp. ASUV-10]
MNNSLPTPPPLSEVPGADKVPLPKSTAIERIYAAYLEDTLKALLPADRQMHSELEAAYALVLNYNTFEDAWPLLAEQFDMSRATCYRRLADAQNLFGDVKKVKKEGRRAILVEFSRKILRLSLQQNDFKSALAAMKFEANLTGLLRADSHGEEGRGTVGATSYVINLHVEGRKPRAVDISKLGDVSDADYELIEAAVTGQVIDVDAMEVLLADRRALEGGAK